MKSATAVNVNNLAGFQFISPRMHKEHKEKGLDSCLRRNDEGENTEYTKVILSLSKDKWFDKLTMTGKVEKVEKVERVEKV